MNVKLAATQMECTWEIENNISKAKKLINDAADKGSKSASNVAVLTDIFITKFKTNSSLNYRSYIDRKDNKIRAIFSQKRLWVVV